MGLCQGGNFGIDGICGNPHCVCAVSLSPSHRMIEVDHPGFVRIGFVPAAEWVDGDGCSAFYESEKSPESENPEGAPF